MTFEYMISAGPGTLLSYGIVDQFTLVDQRFKIEFWGNDENGKDIFVKCPPHLEFRVRRIPTSEKCETGL